MSLITLQFVRAEQTQEQEQKSQNSDSENEKWQNEIHYYVIDTAWVVTKTKNLLELKNGYCPQDRKVHDSFSEVAIETF